MFAYIITVLSRELKLYVFIQSKEVIRVYAIISRSFFLLFCIHCIEHLSCSSIYFIFYGLNEYIHM